MLRLPQIAQIEINHTHRQSHHHGKQKIKAYRPTQRRADILIAGFGIERTYERSQPVSKSQTHQNGNVKDIVDKRCGCERVGRVMPHHGRINETDHNLTYLSHKYRRAEP